MTTTEAAEPAVTWYALSGEETATRMTVDPEQGLSGDEHQRRLARYGPNQLATEPPPSLWSVALRSAVESDEHHAGDRRGRQPRDRPGRDRHLRGAAGDVQRRHGLATGAQGPGERRGAGPAPGSAGPGAARRVESRSSQSIDLVPGDVVLLEAGDVVPADGRILVSATLEVQEAALTGESAPVAEGRARRCPRAMSRSATARTWCSRTPRSRAAPRSSS